MSEINKDFEIGNTGVKLKNLIGYELYSNSNGAISGTLSDNYSNYEKIEITALSGTTNPFFVTGIVYPQKTNRVDLSLIQSEGSPYKITYYKTARVIFNNNSFEISTACSWQDNKETGAGTNISFNDASLKIYKIIGYK